MKPGASGRAARGAAPSPASACARSSAASSAQHARPRSAAVAACTKRGRIGLRPLRPEGAALGDLDRCWPAPPADRRTAPPSRSAVLKIMLAATAGGGCPRRRSGPRRCTAARRAPRSRRARRNSPRWWRRSAAPAVGELKQLRLDLDLVLQAVPLDLDVEPVAEDLLELSSAARPPVAFCPSRSAPSIGPSGPPVSAISPAMRLQRARS